VRNTYALTSTLASPQVDVPGNVRLTPRGRQVLELFMSGLTYKEIGERLGMSKSGISRHREKMFNQNDCDTMRELIAKYRASLESGVESAHSADEDKKNGH
jgi:DNA-binding CsgD family transcriptional regulator